MCTLIRSVWSISHLLTWRRGGLGLMPTSHQGVIETPWLYFSESSHALSQFSCWKHFTDPLIYGTTSRWGVLPAFVLFYYNDQQMSPHLWCLQHKVVFVRCVTRSSNSSTLLLRSWRAAPSYWVAHHSTTELHAHFTVLRKVLSVYSAAALRRTSGAK